MVQLLLFYRREEESSGISNVSESKLLVGGKNWSKLQPPDPVTYIILDHQTFLCRPRSVGLQHQGFSPVGPPGVHG